MKQNNQNLKDKKFSKVAFSHIGCEKNLVDTEHMQGLLDQEGYEVGNNIVPYFYLPLQHSHSDVLKSMNRTWQASLNESILSKIREQIPSAVLRTSLIVGFPGETHKHFQHLLDFLNRHEFDHVGVFIFSTEEGISAFDLPNRVSSEAADARKDNIMSIQQSISKNKKSIIYRY